MIERCWQREDAPCRGPLWIERSDGTRERLTQRREWDRGAQGLGLVMVAGIAVACAFGLGVVHGRANPIEPAPVAEMRGEW